MLKDLCYFIYLVSAGLIAGYSFFMKNGYTWFCVWSK